MIFDQFRMCIVSCDSAAKKAAEINYLIPDLMVWQKCDELESGRQRDETASKQSWDTTTTTPAPSQQRFKVFWLDD